MNNYISLSSCPPSQPLPSPLPSGNIGREEQALVLTFLAMASAAEQGKEHTKTEAGACAGGMLG